EANRLRRRARSGVIFKVNLGGHGCMNSSTALARMPEEFICAVVQSVAGAESPANHLDARCEAPPPPIQRKLHLGRPARRRRTEIRGAGDCGLKCTEVYISDRFRTR